MTPSVNVGVYQDFTVTGLIHDVNQYDTCMTKSVHIHVPYMERLGMTCPQPPNRWSANELLLFRVFIAHQSEGKGVLFVDWQPDRLDHIGWG